MNWDLRTTSRVQRLCYLSGSLLLAALCACNRAEPQQEKDQVQAADAAIQSPTGAAADPPSIAAQVDPSTVDSSVSAAPQAPVLPPPSNQINTLVDPQQSNTKPSNASQAGNATPPSTAAGNQDAGVHIELTKPSIPSQGVETTPKMNENLAQSLAERTFMKIKPPTESTVPVLLGFFGQCDQAIQDLAISVRAKEVDDQSFHEIAKRLSALKLDAAERLMQLPGLSENDQRTAMAARVESLSHLTSLGDLPSATKLKELAEQLTQSQDPLLAHQGRLVLLGFRLNQLQEGQIDDPKELLRDLDKLFQRPEDRGLVELMALQQCSEVLTRLGYAVESKQIVDRIVKEYRDSSDPELSMRAWSLETNGAPAMVAFNEAVKATLEGTEKDPQRVAAASQALLQAFPSTNTLWQITRLLIPLEFSGNVETASQVAQVVQASRAQFGASALAKEVDQFLDCHVRRLGARGKPLNLENLVDFSGKPLDWAAYRGKVVLVCFWAGWDLNSLEELNKLKTLREEIADPAFEILAINLDDINRSNAEQMVMRQNYKWNTFRSSNEGAVGFETPAAKQLGVNAVPFLLLVDRQGTVVGIHIRGDKRPSMIQELLK